MTSATESLSNRSGGRGTGRQLVADLRRPPVQEPSLFPLAVLAGLIGLFVADAGAGGLAGGEGFLVGLFASLVILGALLWANSQRNISDQKQNMAQSSYQPDNWSQSLTFSYEFHASSHISNQYVTDIIPSSHVLECIDNEASNARQSRDEWLKQAEMTVYQFLVTSRWRPAN